MFRIPTSKTWLAAVAVSVFCLTSSLCCGQQLPFYVGTYTGGTSQGVYRSALNLETGALAEPRLVAELTSPSFLTIHPSLEALYAISEVEQGGHQVVSYSIQSDGALTETGNSESGGNGPCFVSTDKAGRFLFVANYGSGSISAYRLKADGSLGAMTCNVQHVGNSADARRQQGPHAHCILIDPSDQYVCAVDLGLDQVIVYRLDRANGKLTSTGSPLKVAPGNGPRHMAFHPDGKQAFVIHEITSKLSSCSWNAETGELAELSIVSTLPENFSGNNSTAEVLVHPSGKFVFGSNRGHNSIAGFRIGAGGMLTSLGQTSTGGKTPRNFRIDPTGQFLLAENQQSDSIVVFQIDQQSGRLAETGHSISVGSPCCIKFVRN